MATWTTLLRDLATTAIRAAGRAVETARSSSSGASSGIEVPDLATVDEARRGQRDRAAGTIDARAPDAPVPPTGAHTRDPADRADSPSTDRPFRPAGPGEPAATAASSADTTDSAADRDRRRRERDEDGTASAGQFGAEATVEVDARDLDMVRTSYNPDTDGDPDPGEIVWTWVPYEEADGRGKDRPVVVVARLSDDAVLAVQLSSRDHDGDRGWVGIGAGEWDGEHRASWVNLDRILRVRPGGMRREAAVLDRALFDRVAAALNAHHHWPDQG